MTRKPERWLDHFIVVVDDLEKAGARWERLGFRVLPKMRHVEVGSANRVMQFHSNYLELFGDIDRINSDFRDHYAERLAIGEGQANLSFSSGSLEADRDALIERGYAPAEIGSARRPVVMPDGRTEDTASRFLYLMRPDRPYLSPFWSDHRKPETIFVPAYQQHPNGAIDVIGITAFSATPEQDAAYVAAISGGTVSGQDGHWRVTLDRGHWVELATPETLRERHGAALPAMPGASGGFGVGVTFHVRSIAACRAAIHASIDRHAGDGDLVVPAAEANGTMLRFVEQANG